VSAPPDPTSATDHDPHRRLRSLLLDIAPLRTNPAFRRLYAARLVSFVGSIITFVALPAQVYDITGSSWRVGLIGLVELVPLVGAALFGGALADRVDRRRLIVVCELAMAACTGLLALNGGRDEPMLWVLYVFAAVAAVFDGLQRPALEALHQQLLTPETMTAGNALSSAMHSTGLIIGPVIGGLIIAKAGFGWAFATDSATFVIGGLLAATLPARRAERDDAEVPESPLADIGIGLRYAWTRKDLLGSYLVDVNAMVFGMPLALFPAMADELGGDTTLGWLYAAPGIGSLIMTVFGAGIPRHVTRHGVGLLWAAAAWGVAIAAFGFADRLWLAVVLLAVAGGADMLSGLFRMAIWNHSIPNDMRGRLAGIEMISYSTGPPLGNVESGFVAALTSVRTSVVSGGVACVAVGGLIAVFLPALRAYRAPTAQPNVRHEGPIYDPS
jgi:MFS family permease